jgi:CRP-like cAMP-binding protein
VSIIHSDLPVRKLAKGETLMAPGDKSRTMYLLRDGTVQISADGVPIHAMSQPGTLIGELAWLLGSDRTATVTATEASSFYVIEDLAQVFKTDKELYLKIAREVCQKSFRALATLLDVKARMLETADALGITVANSAPFASFMKHWEEVSSDTAKRWPFELGAKLDSDKTQKVKKGERLYGEGVTLENLYILKSGSFSLEQTKKERESAATSTKPGATVGGEECVVLEVPTMGIAVALEDSVVAVIPDLRRRIEKDPEIGIALARLFARRVVLLTGAVRAVMTHLDEVVAALRKDHPTEASTIDELAHGIEATMTGIVAPAALAR